MADETLKVRIIADVTSAQSSLKQLNKETNGLGQGTNAANAAVEKLSKSLNSIGVQGFKIKGIFDVFKGGSNAIDRISSGFSKVIPSVEKVKDGFKSLTESVHKFKGLNPWIISKGYMDTMAKKNADSVQQIQTLQRSMTVADMAANNGDFSGLKDIREQIVALAASSDKVIKKTFNERDFSSLKESLIKAGKAAAKESADDYQAAMEEMLTTVGRSTEKFSFKGFGDALKSKLKGFAEEYNRIMEPIGDKIVAVERKLSRALVGGLVGSVALAIKNAFDVSKLGDQIDKASQKVGMSTNTFQQWSYVLERCGIDVSQLQTAMRQLTRKTVSGSDIFKQLGISTEGKSQQQVFEDTVKALQGIQDSTERARKAYEVFGTSALELSPLLNTSASEVARLRNQYDLLGATMNGRAVQASADMQDAITDLKTAFQGLKNTLAEALIPIITNIIVKLTVLVAKINMVLKVWFDLDIDSQAFEDNTAVAVGNIENAISATKQLRTLIAGFDELNIFPSQSEATSGIGGIGSALEDYDIGSTVAPRIGNILPPDAIKELEDFKANIDSVKESIEHLKKVWKGDEEPSGFWEGVLNALREYKDFLGMDYWMPEGKMDWDKFFSFEGMFGTEDYYKEQWTGKFLISIAEAAAPATEKLIQFGSALKKIKDEKGLESGKILKFLDALNQIKESKAEGALLGLWNGLRKLPGALKELLDKSEAFTKVKIKIQELKNSLSDLLDKAGVKQKVEDAKKAFEPLGLKFEEIKGKFTNAFASIGDNLKSIFTKSSKETFNNVEGTALEGTLKLLNTVDGTLKPGVEELYNGIDKLTDEERLKLFNGKTWKDSAMVIPRSIGEACSPENINRPFENASQSIGKLKIFSSQFWKEKFGAINKGMEGVNTTSGVNSIMGSISGSLSEKINGLVNSFNKSSLFGKLGLKLPTIALPHFAKGGVITGTTLGILGEYPGASNNPEIVAPESKMQEVFAASNDDLARVFLECTRQIISAISENQVEINLDGTSLLKSVSKANNSYRTMTGQSMI